MYSMWLWRYIHVYSEVQHPKPTQTKIKPSCAAPVRVLSSFSLSGIDRRPSQTPLGFSSPIARLSGRDGVFKTHFKGNVRRYSWGHISILSRRESLDQTSHFSFHIFTRFRHEDNLDVFGWRRAGVWPTLGFCGWIKCLFWTYHREMCWLCHGYREQNTPGFHTFLLLQARVFQWQSGTMRR